MPINDNANWWITYTDNTSSDNYIYDKDTPVKSGIWTTSGTYTTYPDMNDVIGTIRFDLKENKLFLRTPDGTEFEVEDIKDLKKIATKHILRNKEL